MDSKISLKGLLGKYPLVPLAAIPQCYTKLLLCGRQLLMSVTTLYICSL
jgi:hypothetical protein